MSQICYGLDITRYVVPFAFLPYLFSPNVDYLFIFRKEYVNWY